MTTDAAATRLGANYWKLFSATSIANLGDGLLIVAVPWLASAITRDPLLIAMVALASRLPWLLFSLPAGVITDRVDRRRLIAWMDVTRCAAILVFAAAVLVNEPGLSPPDQVAAGTAEPPEGAGPLLALLFVIALLIGAAEVLRDNSSQTLLPSIVPAERLERANGRMWGAEQVMNQFAGQPLAGLLLGIGFALPFFVNVGTYAIAAALIFTLAGSFAPKGKVATGRISWRAEIGEGLRWLWRHRLLRSLALMLGAQNAAHAMTIAILVLYVQEILRLDARGFGLLVTGGAVGAVAGSLVADRVSARLGPGTTLFVSVAGMTLTYVVVGLTSSAPLMWAMLVLTGIMVVLWNVITVSLRQTIIPDHLLGRVNSVYRFFGWGAISIGGLLGGAVVSAGEAVVGREWALRTPFLLAAAVGAVVFVLALPRLNTRRIEEAKAAAGEIR